MNLFFILVIVKDRSTDLLADVVLEEAERANAVPAQCHHGFALHHGLFNLYESVSECECEWERVRVRVRVNESVRVSECECCASSRAFQPDNLAHKKTPTPLGHP